MGEDVSELLDMIAAQMKVIQIARIKKSCRRCEKMVQEPAPSGPIPGSMAGPNLLAHILVSKFAPSRAVGVCQRSCPPISCGVSDFRGADFVFGVEPDGSGRLPVAGFA